MHHEEDDLNLLEKMGYEGRDMEVGRKGQFGAVLLFVSLAVVTVACWAFIGLIDRTNTFSQPPRVVAERKVTPPKEYPVVQTGVTAKMDMVELRKLEEEKTTKLGWVDKDKGVAQVPVETAIKIVAERGLPTRPGAKAGTP
ncbi:MAG: hypothetical protein JSS65_07270 [Armatimonadetes bacterium]|nr:hypothetical protein [Armatimonadota bacterium]